MTSPLPHRLWHRLVLISILATSLETVSTHLLFANPLEDVAGSGKVGTVEEGVPALQAPLDNPFGVVQHKNGEIWFCDYAAHRIYRISKDQQIHVVAGNGHVGYDGDGGPAEKASLNNPHELRFDKRGNLYFVDTSNHAIRRVDARSNRITTIAGTGQPGYSGDEGPATQARLNLPISLQFGPKGDLYIADIGNHVIRRLDLAKGIIHTFCGKGKPGQTTEAARISEASLVGPRSLDFDARGDLWVVTREGNQVLRFDMKSGVIHIVAGTGKRGFSGDRGPARDATFNGPKGISIGPTGDVYLADTENHAIRKISIRTGIVERVAGTGSRGYDLNQESTQSRLERPHGIYVDSTGAIWIGDSENHRLRRIPATIR